jgi:hypothetical protein
VSRRDTSCDRSKPVFETPADTQVRFGKPTRRRGELAMHKVVFESDTPAGRVFDLVVIAAILASVAVVVADSMPNLRAAPSHDVRGHRVGLHLAVHGRVHRAPALRALPAALCDEPVSA